jgi:hypothetical protein
MDKYTYNFMYNFTCAFLYTTCAIKVYIVIGKIYKTAVHDVGQATLRYASVAICTGFLLNELVR